MNLPEPAARDDLFPPEVIQLAIEEAYRLAESIANVAGVGQGYKHSSQDGYGRSLRPCITFFVNRKLKQPAQGTMIPPTLQVTYGGNAYNVPTDVESMGQPKHHNGPPCYLAGQSERAGTPCMLLEGDNSSRYLITAGHVVTKPNETDPDGRRFAVDGKEVGEVVNRLTFFKSEHNAWCDVATIRLDDGVRLPNALNQRPWTASNNYYSIREIMAHLDQGLRITYSTNGAKNKVEALFENIIHMRHYFGDEVDLMYAPVLIRSRAYTGHFSKGDSGSSFYDVQNRIVAMHVIGRGMNSKVSWAISAESIIKELETRLETTLRVVSVGEI